MISDRIKIMRNAAWPEINIAPQQFISCDTVSQGCKSGKLSDALEQAYAWDYLTDETCSIYRGLGHTQDVPCAPIIKCINCKPHDACMVPDEYQIFEVSNPTRLNQVEVTIQEAIYKDGPVACGIQTSAALSAYKAGDILKDTTKFTAADHYVEIVGWGVDEKSKDKYWMVRNSWGSNWGDKGFFKILRGANTLGIESECMATFPIATWDTNTMKI